jgi:phosphoglycerate kinase
VLILTLDENFNVTDATRIEAAKPTIDAILAQGGVILMSHLETKRLKKNTH